VGSVRGYMPTRYHLRKRRVRLTSISHSQCNEEAPCSNCIRHSVACSLAGGPNVPREDAKAKQRSPATSISSHSTRTSSHEIVGINSTTAAPISRTPSISVGASPTDSTGYNPIQILTGSIDRNAALTNQAWILDLELMHHFTAFYSEVMTEHFDIMETMWQHEMPRIAFRSQYVMHGLLGFSALHLATVQPERALLLRASATNHLDQALGFYRQDTGPATAENADARFTFTWLVAMFAFAIPSSVSPIDAMVELFSLVRGIEVVLQESLIWIIQGPFAPILTRAFVESKGLSTDGSALSMAFAFQASTSHTNGADCVLNEELPEGMDFGLNHLDFMIGMHSMIPEERRTCVLVLAELKQLYAQMLSSQGSCGMSMVMCFPKQDPSHFSLLLKRRVPQALIILAYYTVLLDLLDARWWINGWGRRVLSDVVGSLGDEWKSWIDWPVQTVLMKPVLHQSASLSPCLSLDAAMMG
jgi:hypothetical protein